ncbi:choline ABC transporter permease subunit [Desulfuribacillus alkaliarsenatis]|uniref:Choline ABC transporter permease subunit n=1 Tax=Desulfuribacillus alkaliarsenatis TaxID=766136 RepID=A0A1E5G2C7_9FIRM|nr:choline ABC transporter permease subunit [Desulfuribacillus alkaliarsenatis]OEF96691.1 choline ABC transporter permease subunit [Desulfuribacillus alkaliarsenatis]
MDLIPRIPLGSWVDDLVNWMTREFSFVFDLIARFIRWFIETFVDILVFFPPLALIALLAALAWWTSRWPVAIFTVLGLLLIDNIGYWSQMIDTLALVITAVIISVIIGIPIGIAAAQSDRLQSIIAPILDFMQTMPAFVYLIPAILFFNIGVVPGVFASVIFAMPPTIRLTNLGIRQVPKELIEAADAFGSTRNQKLYKVQLPLAMPTIMAGINQSVMLALSMVVIASLVGAPGLGAEVYRAVSQIQVGRGFEAGLAIVILAIMLDRISQNIYKKR